MDFRADGDVEANSAKCRRKWTVRGQLLAPGGFSSGHQASHHGDAHVTMVTAIATDPPTDTDAAKTLPCSFLIRDSF